MADNIQATPRNYLGGLLSDAYGWMQSPERTQQMQGFASLLGTTGIPQTVERMAYGEPLTNISRANVPLLKPETADALMTVAPMAGPAMRGAGAAARGAGRLAGEAVNEAMVYGRGPLASITPQPMGIMPKSIVREGNPIQSAVVLVGDRIFTGNTHTDAFNRAIYEGAIRKEGGKFIYPKDAEVNSDLFMTKDGQIIDRLQASKMFDIGASETAIKEGLMQNKPPSSMSVDSYIEQAKAIKQQKEKPSFTYPQEEAMRLAQQRAALPKEQGGLGLLSSNTADERAAAMGFNDSGYTGTAADITRFDPSKAGRLGSGSREGPLGTWLTDDPRVASGFADWSSRGQGGNVVYPLKIMGNPAELNSYSDLKDIVDANTKFNRAPYRMMQDKVDYDAARKQLDSMGDYVAMRNINTDAIDKPITQYVVTDSDKLRSRFAAFDPFRRTASVAAAMGVAAPDLLAQDQPVITQQQIDDEMAKYGLLGR
jgi:hypothetical protein